MHPTTQQFLHLHFGLTDEPRWWKKRKELIPELAYLWDIRQSTYYEGRDRKEFLKQQLKISKRFRIPYRIINHLLGVAATDGSDTYGVIRDYLSQGDPRLTRTQR